MADKERNVSLRMQASQELQKAARHAASEQRAWVGSCTTQAAARAAGGSSALVGPMAADSEAVRLAKLRGDLLQVEAALPTDALTPGWDRATWRKVGRQSKSRY